MKKRILTFLMASLMLLTAFPAEAMAMNTDAPDTELETDAAQFETETGMETADTYAAQAKSQGGSDTLVTEAEVYINPEYIDVLTQEDIPVPQSAEAQDDYGISTFSLYDGITYIESYEEAGAALREGMAAREETIVVYYYGEAYTQEYFKDLVTNHIIPAALAETGVPDEGDYLRYNYGGMGYKAGIKKDESGELRYYEITFTPKYYTTAAQEAEVDTKVDAVLNSFDFGAETSDYDKIYAVYDYVCSSVTYDNANLNDSSYTLKYTTYAAAINGTAVCQGYASFVYRLLRELDINVRVATGYGGTEYEDASVYYGNHAWNIIQIDEKWYCADATWDAGFSDAVQAGTYSYQYFLKGTSDFDTLEAPYNSDGIHYLIIADDIVWNYNIEETKYTGVCEHTYEAVTTLEPTVTKEGVITYTCTKCGDSWTETIPALTPDVELSLSQNGSKIRMTGEMTNVDQTTTHGFIYITKARLGAKTLTVNSSGRTKLTVNGYNDDGSYRYSMTPKTENTTYVIRAFATYKNDAGKTVYVYSDPMYVKYSDLA